jgi:hypothetical protein
MPKLKRNVLLKTMKLWALMMRRLQVKQMVVARRLLTRRNLLLFKRWRIRRRSTDKTSITLSKQRVNYSTSHRQLILSNSNWLALLRSGILRHLMRMSLCSQLW